MVDIEGKIGPRNQTLRCSLEYHKLWVLFTPGFLFNTTCSNRGWKGLCSLCRGVFSPAAKGVSMNASNDKQAPNARLILEQGHEQSEATSGWVWMRKLWGWLRPMLIQEVPEDLAVCEFICAEPQCKVGDWENCELRKAYQELERHEAEEQSAILSSDPEEVRRHIVH